jgi:hypothetical protein
VLGHDLGGNSISVQCAVQPLPTSNQTFDDDNTPSHSKVFTQTRQSPNSFIGYFPAEFSGELIAQHKFEAWHDSTHQFGANKNIDSPQKNDDTLITTGYPLVKEKGISLR